MGSSGTDSGNNAVCNSANVARADSTLPGQLSRTALLGLARPYGRGHVPVLPGITDLDEQLPCYDRLADALADRPPP